MEPQVKQLPRMAGNTQYAVVESISSLVTMNSLSNASWAGTTEEDPCLFAGSA
jgi:hypothetical protein